MPTSSRGDIAIYIALITALTMLGSAVLLSLILARQITLTRDIVASERAFYAANAGQEEAFYKVATGQENPVSLTGTIEYPSSGLPAVASYTATMSFQNNLPCGAAEGIFPAPNGTKRRLAIGAEVCP